MQHIFEDLIRHNDWANRQILAVFTRLDAANLEATVPGTFGTLIHTLRHIVGSECSYLFRLSGAAQLAWRELADADLDALRERMDALATVWEEYIRRDTSPEWRGEARGDEGEIFAVPAGVLVAQALHHGNQHRAHICTILGALGYEAPDVSGWGYADAMGRMTLKRGPDGAPR